MDFDWDERKAKSNLKKHGVDFADAVGVLYDDRALTIVDTEADEERHITLGLDLLGRLLVVVYTWRDESIRLISARKATRHESKQYAHES